MEVFRDFDGTRHILSARSGKEHKQLTDIARSVIVGGKTVAIICGDGIHAARVSRILGKLAGGLLEVRTYPPDPIADFVGTYPLDKINVTAWTVAVSPKE